MTKKPAMELNLRTKALGLSFDDRNLYVAAIHNKFNQVSYRGHAVLENYQALTDEEIRDFLDDFRTNYKIKGGDAFMALPRDRVMVQIADFPLEARGNLDEALAYQVGNYFPVDPEEYTFFPQVLSKSEQLKVMIVAVRKEHLGTAFSFIRRWGLKLAGLTLESFATVNGLGKIDSERVAQSKIVIFRHYPEGLEMLAINEGRLVGSHYFSFDPTDEDFARDMLPEIEEGFSQSRLDPNEVDLYLESGLDVHGVAAFLQEDTGIPLDRFSDAQGQVIEAEAMPGLGAAVSAVQESLPLDLNMLPENQRKRHKLLPLILVSVLLVIGGLFMLVSEIRSYTSLKKEHSTVSRQHAAVFSAMNEIRIAKEDFESKSEEFESYKPYLASRMMYRLIDRLAQQLPLDTYITNFQIKNGDELTIQGESDDPFQTQRILSEIPYLKNVEPGTAITTIRNREGKKRFMFKADIDLEAMR